VIITIIVGWNGSSASPSENTALYPAEHDSQSYSEDISEDRFLLENQLKNVYSVEYIPFRTQKTKWTEEQVAQYWQDAREAGVEVLQEKNTQLIKKLLSDVP